jgi:orotidine-5'-phosphate decarboxylase
LSFRERMRKSADAHRSRLVLALDFADPYETRLARAAKVLDATKGEIAGVKVNHHLLLPYGLGGVGEIVEECRQEGLPLIADLKMNDIEATNLNIVDSLFSFGFDAVIANPFVGKEEGLGKVMEKVHTMHGGVILLVYMSHKGADEGYALRLEGGEPIYRVFAARARDWGADGVIVSAKATDKITEVRGIVGKECMILTPGVGAQGGGASSSLEAGADYVLVGRSVTESTDPLKAVRQLQDR